MGSQGAAGNVTINAERVTIRDGSLVGSPTLGSGRGGDIAIDASDLAFPRITTNINLDGIEGLWIDEHKRFVAVLVLAAAFALIVALTAAAPAVPAMAIAT